MAAIDASIYEEFIIESTDGSKSVDIAKGVVPVVIARSCQLDDSWQVVAGIAALSGHVWPIWLRERRESSSNRARCISRNRLASRCWVIDNIPTCFKYLENSFLI